jgi:hypothetical protein
MDRLARTLAIVSAPVAWLFFHLPMELLAGNAGEVAAPAALVLYAAGAVTLAVLLASALAIAVLPGILHRLAAALVVAAFAVAFLYASLPLGTEQVLDGAVLRFTADEDLRRGSLAAAAGLAAIVLLLQAKLLALLPVPFVLGSVFLVGVPLVRLGALDARFHDVPRIAVADLARFSEDANVLVLLLDGAQSDLVWEVLDEDEALRRSLAGFTFYADALGIFPSTMISLPLLQAGRTVEDGRAFRRLQEEGPPASVLVPIAEAGWDVAVVAPAPSLCPSGIDECATIESLPEHRRDRAIEQYLLLFDLVLLRTVPYQLRDDVYSGGLWATRRLVREEGMESLAARHNAFLRAFAGRVSSGAEKPTLRFLHVMSTHLPFDLDADCEATAAADPGPWRERARRQTACGLRAAAAVVDALHERDLADATTVLLVSDHGSHVGREVEADASLELDDLGLGPLTLEDVPRFTQLASTASPLLMMKPFGASAPLERDERPVQLVDVAPTLCEVTAACDLRSADASPLPPVGRSAERPRRYAHSPTGFGLDVENPSFTLFEVKGPIHRERSWRLLEKGPALAETPESAPAPEVPDKP